MEKKVQLFLSNCGISKKSEGFIHEKQKLAKTIIETKDFQKNLERYSALSNKNRLLIYNLIKQEKMCNCVLAQILSLTEGSVTHHTKILENAGLIIGRKRGHFTIYYTPENLKKII